MLVEKNERIVPIISPLQICENYDFTPMINQDVMERAGLVKHFQFKKLMTVEVQELTERIVLKHHKITKTYEQSICCRR